MYTLKEKKQLLVDLILLEYKLGYSITDRIGKPLSYFNFDAVSKLVTKLKSEYLKDNGYNFEGETVI